jgi:hypothetical protein
VKSAKWLVTVAAVLLAGGLSAQEGATPQKADEATAPEERPTPARKIRVLEDPYDLASFYRSSSGSAYGYGSFAYDRDGSLRATDRYPIARYYRTRPGETFGYWRAQSWKRASGFPYRTHRRTGRVGDLYLLAPTFLTPVGPAAGEYLGAGQ